METLRCDARLHGRVSTYTDKDVFLEVRCKSQFCGHERGVVVIHRFNLRTGAHTTTRFKDPINRRNAGDA